MKFTAKRHELFAALTRARKLSDPKTSPFAAHARLTAAKSGVTIYATDSTIFVSSTVNADVEKPAEIGVMAGAMADMVDRMPEGDVVVEFAPSDGTGSTRLRIHAARRSFLLPFIGTADMPPVRDMPKLSAKATVAGDVISSAIRRVLPAASTDQTRSSMAGVAWDGRGDTLKLIATDGHRMHLLEVGGVAVKTTNVPTLHTAGAKFVESEFGSASDVAIAVTNEGFAFSAQGVAALVPHVDGVFPPYERLIPEKQPTTAKVDAKEFGDAVSAAGMCAGSGKDIGGVQISIAGSAIRVTGESDKQSASDEVDAEVTGKGSQFGMTHFYLIAAIKASQAASVTIGAGGKETDPVTLRAGDFTALLMPRVK